MSTKKQPAVYTMTGCSVINEAAPANEHTRASVVALANAVEANARAIETIARALNGGASSIGTGIRLGPQQE